MVLGKSPTRTSRLTPVSSLISRHGALAEIPRHSNTSTGLASLVNPPPVARMLLKATQDSNSPWIGSVLEFISPVPSPPNA